MSDQDSSEVTPCTHAGCTLPLGHADDCSYSRFRSPHLKCAGCGVWCPGAAKPPQWTEEAGLHYCFECSEKRRRALRPNDVLAKKVAEGIWAATVGKVVSANYTPMRRLRDIIDESFGMQPVMSDEEALSFLERKLFEARRDVDKASPDLPASLRACLDVLVAGGTLVSSGQCSEVEIAAAQACDRFYVDSRALGYVARPKSGAVRTDYPKGDIYRALQCVETELNNASARNRVAEPPWVARLLTEVTATLLAHDQRIDSAKDAQREHERKCAGDLIRRELGVEPSPNEAVKP